jgi:hypothetical protein
MNPLSPFKLVIPSALCAALIGCASTDTTTTEVVRTPPPRNYEKTITDYLAFKIRNPQKNAEVNFGAPEPGACALDAYTTSSRGWVVPVAYLTRTGEATGKETIRINTKQYYFWFLGNTIAGITPRIELCPGNGPGFEAPPTRRRPRWCQPGYPDRRAARPRAPTRRNEVGRPTPPSRRAAPRRRPRPRRSPPRRARRGRRSTRRPASRAARRRRAEPTAVPVETCRRAIAELGASWVALISLPAPTLKLALRTDFLGAIRTTPGLDRRAHWRQS